MWSINVPVSRWMYRLVTALVACFSTVEWLIIRRRVVVTVIASISILGLAYGYASGGCGVIPPLTRLANICAALGSGAGCEWREITHLRGYVTLIVFDPSEPGAPWNPVLAVTRIRGRDVSMPIFSASEQHVRDVIDNPETDYHNLLIGSAAWPALRELARLPWDRDTVVPILLDGKALKPKPVSSEATTDAMAEIRSLRVRIALVTLR